MLAKFLVSVELPDDMSIRQMAEYIKQAVKYHKDYSAPNSPTHLDKNSVRVSWRVKRKGTQR